MSARPIRSRGVDGGAVAAVGPTDAAGAPRRGGVLTWGQWDKNDPLDPAISSSGASHEILDNVLGTLVVMGEDQTVYPSLATKWTIEGNGAAYTFTLRDNIKFHDGTMLDAQTVKRNFERLLDPSTKGNGGEITAFGPVDRIEAPDPTTVVVRFKQPYPLFLRALWRASTGILSARVLDATGRGETITDIVGSGPYRYMGRSPDGVVTLEAYADYAMGSKAFKNPGAPYMQTLKFRPITDGGTRVATLESGENLLIDELAEADYARLKSDPRFRFVESPRRGIAQGFFINVTRPPTDESGVRQALNWAVDRKAIVDKLFFGVHKPTIGPLSEGVWGRWDGAEQMLGYNPGKAQQLLEEASWRVGSDAIRVKGGQRLALVLVTYASPWNEIAEVLQAQYRAVGIDLQIQKMEKGPFLDFTRGYTHNLASSGGTNIDADVLRSRYGSEGIPLANQSNLRDPQLDALLTRGTQLMQGPEREQNYEAVQRRLMELLPFVSIMSQVRVEAMSAKVHDLRMGAAGQNALPLVDTWLSA